MKNFVQSGAAADEEAAAWPYDENSFIEPFKGSASQLANFVYDLQALTFDELLASTKINENNMAIELKLSNLHSRDLKNQITDVFFFGLDHCSAEDYGDYSKTPGIVTLADLDLSDDW